MTRKQKTRMHDYQKEGIDLQNGLRQRWNIVIKALMHGSTGLRASVPFFLLEDEIDLLIEKLAELTQKEHENLTN
jgi:selenocysteine lyase/cysteine desulfurase